MSLCDSEKIFILHGVAENLRLDGREREDYRPMELETNVVAHAFGSSRLRLANTDVLVAVKIEVDTPYPDRPCEGKLDFFVDCSANATPDFEGRGGENLAIELSNILASAYRSKEAFDLTKLCIMKGKKCWKIYVDILLLEVGGNLFDAVSIAVKSALWDTQIPRIKSVNVDGGNVDIQVHDDIFSCTKLEVSRAPLMVTVCKIGDKCIVDPNAEEEQCSTAALVVAVSEGRVSTILQTGSGSFHPATLKECIELSVSVAQKLQDALMETLGEICDNKEDIGFLK